MKLDIEGAEEQLFSRGAGEWLDRVETIVVEIHGPSAEAAVTAAVAGRGFQRWSQAEKTILMRNRGDAPEPTPAPAAP